MKGGKVGGSDTAGFSWSSRQLLIDTLEASGSAAAFREAAASKFLEWIRGEVGSNESSAQEKAIVERFLDFVEPLEQKAPRTDGLPGKCIPVNLKEFKEFLELLGAFNSEAALNAHSNYRSRYLVVFVGPDRIGVLAELTRRLAALSCVVEGATMVVVAGQVATMLVVSGPNNLTQQQVAANLAGLPAKLFPAHPDFAAAPQVAPVQSRDPGWPRRGSTGWHLYAEVPDRFGTLATITAVIARHKVPLTSFATWLSEKGLCVLDLNYAVQPEVDGDLIAVDLRDALEERAAAVIQLYPSTQPVHSRADRFSPPSPGRAVVVTVLGRAEPGLVAAVTRGLCEQGSDGQRFNIMGSAMTILQGQTAVALVIESGRLVDASLLDEARRAAGRYLDPDSFDASVAGVFPLTHLPGRTVPPANPTHQLRCVAPEQGGVLAALSEALADAGANILWVMARVVDRSANGLTRAEIEVRLDIAAPSLHPGKVDEAITHLRGTTGWQLDLSAWGAVRDS